MPDKFGFNHWNVSGRPFVKCIEEECDAEGFTFYWSEEIRKAHFMEHSPLVLDEGNRPVFKGSVRRALCRICNSEFEQERKRGRPRVFCYT